MIMNQNQFIGKNLKILRRKQGFAHCQIAEYLEITPEALKDLENGIQPIPTPLMSLLANLYGVDKYDLYEENMSSDSAIPDFDFRVDYISVSDLKQIASFKKIIGNFLNMTALLEGNQH